MERFLEGVAFELCFEKKVGRIGLAERKEGHLTICDSVGGRGGHFDKCNKSDRKRQMPYDFIYMWTLKNEMNEQPEEKQTHGFREHTDVCWRGRGLGDRVRT